MVKDQSQHSDLAYADTLRGQVDTAEYKRVVLGLLFLKYIFDSFGIAPGTAQGRAGESRHQRRTPLKAEKQ